MTRQPNDTMFVAKSGGRGNFVRGWRVRDIVRGWNSQESGKCLTMFVRDVGGAVPPRGLLAVSPNDPKMVSVVSLGELAPYPGV
jgi:hypothetical protein